MPPCCGNGRTERPADLSQPTRVVEGRREGLGLVQIRQNTPEVARRKERRSAGRAADRWPARIATRGVRKVGQGPECLLEKSHGLPMAAASWPSLPPVGSTARPCARPRPAGHGAQGTRPARPLPPSPTSVSRASTIRACSARRRSWSSVSWATSWVRACLNVYSCSGTGASRRGNRRLVAGEPPAGVPPRHLGHGLEQHQGYLRADDGGGLQELFRLRRQPIDAGCQHGLHRGRHLDTRQRPAPGDRPPARPLAPAFLPG